MDRHCGHKRDNEPTSHHIEWVVVLGALAFGASVGAQSVEKQASSEGAPPTISDAELDEFEARLKYSQPHMVGSVIFGVIAEQGRNRVEALLRAGQTRRPAALWGIQWQMMFAQDRLEAKTLTGEARKEHFRKALAYLQESYDATTHALQHARAEKGTEEKHAFEHAPAEQAYASFVIAVKNMPNPPRTDRDIYNWLADSPAKVRADRDKHNGLADKLAKVLDDYELPDYETWLRHICKARNEMLRDMIPNLQGELALAALEAGEMATAKRHASELLKNNTDSKSWSYGNIIHNMNEILGRVALREGKVAEAKRHLLKAGQTPGSPQLNSYGPSMDLARELLEEGERNAVIEYLDLIGTFWGQGYRYKANERFSRKKRALLQQWKTDIRAGKIPKHRKWLRPGDDSKDGETPPP